MAPVGKHSGEHHSSDAPRSRGRLLLLALGISATLVPWGVLVYAAIDFGRDARSGDTTAWVFLVLGTAGAAACLFLTLILGSRVLTLVKGSAARQRPQDGHRAAR